MMSVRGLKIVMPKNMNPEFFAEAGQIGRVMREYKLLEIDIGSVRSPLPEQMHS